MNKLKLVILVCGLVGLAELLWPIIDGSSLLGVTFERGVAEGLALAAVFVLPTAMAVLALLRPPLHSWQAGIAFAGFALGAMKFQIWKELTHLGSIGLHGNVTFAALVVGGLASIVALLRPEVRPA